MDNFDKLKYAAEKLNLNVSRETFEMFEIYSKFLIEWNTKINLTAITDPDEIFTKHFIDSINIYNLKEIRNDSCVIDVGTGAGFPGLPMKIVNNSINLTLLDPLNKRLKFLDQVIMELGLKEVTLIHGRAEDVSRETSHRENYDLAVSRAVANFPILCEYCLPFVKKDGHFVALKGPGIQDELNLNKSIISELGGKLSKIEIVKLEDFEHNLVLVKKIKSTPEKYPRKNSLIKKDSDRYKAIIEELKQLK